MVVYHEIIITYAFHYINGIFLFQIEKTAVEENLTKTFNEKEMFMKELAAKNESLSQLETMIEQLQGNQPDSVKLLATMESDKVAASRAVQQNKELKEQMESMQEVFMKLVSLTIVSIQSFSLQIITVFSN